MINERNQAEIPEWQRQAWLTEYQVREQDSDANSQGYWTLAGIFIAVSTALLAGLIGGILSNESLFNIIFCQNEPKKILTLGIIVLIVGTAMIFILLMLKKWLKRNRFNISINQERMKEIELESGMSSWWRVVAADKYKKMEGSFKCNEQKVNDIVNKIAPNMTEERKTILKAEILKLIDNTEFSKKCCIIFRKKSGKIEYEPPSSTKHHPLIFNTLILLWVLVISTAIFLIMNLFSHWIWGLILGILITVAFIYYFIKEIWELHHKEQNS